jgi:hypothetical protein
MKNSRFCLTKLPSVHQSSIKMCIDEDVGLGTIVCVPVDLTVVCCGLEDRLGNERFGK